MFLRKNVLFVLMVGFPVVVFAVSGFAEEVKPEPTQVDTSAIEESPDAAAKVIPANYQAVELVGEIGVGMFSRSTRIVFSPDNKVVYVADQSGYRILAFDMRGGLLFSFGGRKLQYVRRRGLTEDEAVAEEKAYDEKHYGKFTSLMDIGVDAKGNIYAADYADNGVNVFTSEGKFVLLMPLQIGLQKKTPGCGASGVAVNSRGDIYITDNANSRIQVNDLNGKYKYQITKFKDKTGAELALIAPGSPRINSSDELYVMDPLICRVHRFNFKGGYRGSFGYMGDGAGGFSAPINLAIDKLDRVYVADTGLGVIQVFSKEGKFLYALCDENGKRLDLPFVNGINVDSDGLIYISANYDKGWGVRVFKYSTKTAK